jgi:Protein of unknown function (DUF2637)
MTDMSEHAPRHAHLTAARSLLADNPLLPGVAGIGFAVSFQTIAKLAEAHGLPGWPVLYPIGVDVGILALIVESRKAIDDGRSDLVPRALAWLLSGFTIYVNGNGSPAHDWLGRSLHVVMPCLWVAFLELTRWRRLAKKRAEEKRERIPRARWLASPWRTPGMWRRMIVHDVRSYPVAVAREDARLLAMDLAAAVYGRRWKREAPALLRHHLRTGTLPDAVASACSMARPGYAPAVAGPVEDWIAGAPKQAASAAARVKREQHAIETPAGAPEPGQKARQHPRQGSATGRARANAKAARLLTANPGMPLAEVAAKSGVSERTASRIKSGLPTPLHLAAKEG